MGSFNDIQLNCRFWFFFHRKLVQDNFFFFFFVVVPVKDESANTFLSSSLQKSPSATTNGLTREETLVINQTISPVVADDDKDEIEQNKPTVSDVGEEHKEERKHSTPVTPLSALNPEATPFFTLPTNNIESTRSTSTGDESDDENDSNETPISSGKW